ncbi:MAG TPA: hydrogenase maturation protease [Pirellulales bacterium]|jgi:hydrogenase maturation protease|nr:hydrogenase maturation protease [Pirellulales bacterium]
MKSETLVVGLGSSHGDDQFGWHVAEQLAAQLDIPGVTVRRALSPADILDWLDEVERLIVCDACQNLGAPGRLHRWRWPDDRLSELRFAGSHDLGLSAALGLAERLGVFPAEVSIWCGEGIDFGAGQSMSPVVQTAASDLVRQIQDELMRVKA